MGYVNIATCPSVDRVLQQIQQTKLIIFDVIDFT